MLFDETPRPERRLPWSSLRPCAHAPESPRLSERRGTAAVPISPCTRRTRRVSSFASSTHDGRETAFLMRATHGVRLARLCGRRRPGAALRLPRRRSVGAGGAGCASTRRTCCSIRTRARVRRRGGLVEGRLLVRHLRSRDGPRSERDATHGAPARRRRRPDVRLGRRRAAEHAAPELGHLRGARQGPDDIATPTCPQSSAGPTSALGTKPVIVATCASSASPPSSFCRCTASSTTSCCSRQRAPQLLGLQLDRLLRARRALPRGGAIGVRGAPVQGDGEGAARRGHRGDPRRRLQPHRRGQSPRPDASASRASTTATYYRLVADNPRLLLRLHGHRQHPQRAPPADAAADHGFALRYWVQEMHVDGFRFDLASTLARELHEVDQLSSFFTVIHQDPVIAQVKLIAEPWDVGEGGYQVGQFPGALGRVERPLPRRDARASGAATAARPASSATASPAAATSTSATAGSPSASINFITAHDGFTLRRSRHLQPQAQRGERRGQPRRRRTTTTRGTAASKGATDDPEREPPARAADAQLPGDAAALARHADDLRRRRDRAHPARQQQRLLPGQRDQLDRLGARRRAPRAARSSLGGPHPPPARAPAPPAARSFFEGREIRGVGVRDVVWFRHDGAPMTDDDWDNPSTSSLGVFIAGLGHRRDRRGGRTRSSTTTCSCSSTRARADLDFVLPAFGDRAHERTLGAARRHRATTREERRRARRRRRRSAARSLKMFARRALGAGRPAQWRTGRRRRPTACSSGRVRLPDARAVVDYLAASASAASTPRPISGPRRGSTHGYDVVDHATLEPGARDRRGTSRLDGRDARARHQAHPRLRARTTWGSARGENRWWNDVLENGPSSVYADYFDIEWDPPTPALREQGAAAGARAAVRRGARGRQALRRARTAARFRVAYYERTLPGVAAELRAAMLEAALDAARRCQRRSSGAGAREHRRRPAPPAAAVGDDASPSARSARARRRSSSAGFSALFETSPVIAPRSTRRSSTVERRTRRASKGSCASRTIASATGASRPRRSTTGASSTSTSSPPSAWRTRGVRRGARARPRSDRARGGSRAAPRPHRRPLRSRRRTSEALQVGRPRGVCAEGGRSGDVPIYVVAEKILERGRGAAATWAISGTTRLRLPRRGERRVGRPGAEAR